MVESRSSRWTPQEDALFRRMAEANTRPEIIATKLNRSVHAIKARALLRWGHASRDYIAIFCRLLVALRDRQVEP